MTTKTLALCVLAAGMAVGTASAAPRRDVDRFSGSIVLQPRYLNQKDGSFARPVKVTYTACVVQPLLEGPVREIPKYDRPCVRAEDDFQFARGPLVRSRGQSVSGLGLGATRLLPETRRLLAQEGITSRITPGAAFAASKPAGAASDCCGGSTSAAPVIARATIPGVLK